MRSEIILYNLSDAARQLVNREGLDDDLHPWLEEPIPDSSIMRVIGHEEDFECNRCERPTSS